MLYFYHAKVRLKKFVNFIEVKGDLKSFGTVELEYEITTNEQFDSIVRKMEENILSAIKKYILSKAEKQLEQDEFLRIRDNLQLNREDIEVEFTAFNRL